MWDLPIIKAVRGNSTISRVLVYLCQKKGEWRGGGVGVFRLLKEIDANFCINEDSKFFGYNLLYSPYYIYATTLTYVRSIILEFLNIGK